MKTLFITLLILIVVSMCSSKIQVDAMRNISITQYGQEFETKGTTKITDLDNMLSLIVPDKWTVYGKENYFSSSNLVLGQSYYPIVMEITVTDNSDDPNWKFKDLTINSTLNNQRLGDILLDILEKTDSVLDKNRVVERDSYGNKYTIDGIPVVYILEHYTPYDDDPSARMLGTALDKDLHITFRAWTHPDNFLEARPIIEKIINSIRILSSN